MSMTEVWIIVKNSFWILGLAILLATWSYARYTAHEAGLKTQEKLNELKYALTISLGMLLFIVGMAITETRIWAQVLWVLIGIAVLIQAVLQLKELRTSPPEAENNASED